MIIKIQPNIRCVGEVNKSSEPVVLTAYEVCVTSSVNRRSFMRCSVGVKRVRASGRASPHSAETAAPNPNRLPNLHHKRTVYHQRSSSSPAANARFDIVQFTCAFTCAAMCEA